MTREYVKGDQRRTPLNPRHEAALRNAGWEPRCLIRFGWALAPHVDAGRIVLVDCRLGENHDGPHQGIWRHGLAGTQGHTNITWQTADRRAFAGPWAQCDKLYPSDIDGKDARCLLPAGHPRNCAA